MCSFVQNGSAMSSGFAVNLQHRSKEICKNVHRRFESRFAILRGHARRLMEDRDENLSPDRALDFFWTTDKSHRSCRLHHNMTFVAGCSCCLGTEALRRVWVKMSNHQKKSQLWTYIALTSSHNFFEKIMLEIGILESYGAPVSIWKANISALSFEASPHSDVYLHACTHEYKNTPTSRKRHKIQRNLTWKESSVKSPWRYLYRSRHTRQAAEKAELRPLKKSITTVSASAPWMIISFCKNNQRVRQ